MRNNGIGKPLSDPVEVPEADPVVVPEPDLVPAGT